VKPPRALPCLLLALALAGCGPPPNGGKDAKKPKQEEKKLVQTVETTSGRALSKGPPPKREPQWFVKWEEASVNLVQPKILANDADVAVTTATMKGVTGNLFEGDKPGSTFQADEGLADGAKRVLTLEGNVHLRSIDPNAESDADRVTAELTCDRIVYDAINEVIHAQGHVRIKGKVGTIGTLSEILAKKNLERIATPGMFYQK